MRWLCEVCPFEGRCRGGEGIVQWQEGGNRSGERYTRKRYFDLTSCFFATLVGDLGGRETMYSSWKLQAMVHERWDPSSYRRQQRAQTIMKNVVTSFVHRDILMAKCTGVSKFALTAAFGALLALTVSL